MRPETDLIAMLKGLVPTLPADASHEPPSELYATPLSLLGEAMRAEVEIGQRARGWLRTIPLDYLAPALRELAREAREDWHEDSFSRLRNEQVDAAISAALYAVLRRGARPHRVPSVVELSGALVAARQRLGWPVHTHY